MQKTYTTVLLAIGLSAPSAFAQSDFTFTDASDHITFGKPAVSGDCAKYVSEVYADNQKFSVLFNKNWEVKREHGALENKTFDTCTVSIEATADAGYSFRWVKTKFFGRYKISPGHVGEIIVDALVGTNEVESEVNFKREAKDRVMSERLVGFPILFKRGQDTHFPCGATFGNQLNYTLQISGDTEAKYKNSVISLQAITGEGSAAAIEIPFKTFKC